MNVATVNNYRRYFGADAFVPGYCGKCPAATDVHGPVCSVYEEGDQILAISPMSEPPKDCPIRHISTRYASTAPDRRSEDDE